MHLYFLTRGIINHVNQFITELQGKYLPSKINDKDGKIVDCFTQIAVRPIQLWELVFPEEHKDLVLTTILGTEKATGNYRGYGGGKLTQHARHDKFIWGLRLGLGAEPIGNFSGANWLPVQRGNVETIGIGLKKDYWINSKGERIDKKEEGAFEGV